MEFRFHQLIYFSSYLSNGTQRIKINDPILGPLLFNVGLIDLFFVCENDDIASYANDTTPYYAQGTLLL